MTLREVFDIWKQSDYKGLKCLHGGLEGGPAFLDFGSCHSGSHPDVRYGWNHCPANCPDFHEISENQLYSIFLTLYRHSSTFYNEEYNIDKDDPDYMPDYDPAADYYSDYLSFLKDSEPF